MRNEREKAARKYGVRARGVQFRADERRLAGRVFWSPDSPPRFGLLFVHGLDSSQRRYRLRAERVVAALGFPCLTFDLSGHGASPGNLGQITASDHLGDVLAAYDRLAQRVPTGRIGICGASYGGYLAALAVSHRPVQRLLLRAPALYHDQLLEKPVNDRRRQSSGQAHAVLSGLADFQGDVLVLESEHDEVISHETIRTYLDASAHGSHAVIPGASHSLINEEWDDFFVDEIIQWFRPFAVGG